MKHKTHAGKIRFVCDTFDGVRNSCFTEEEQEEWDAQQAGGKGMGKPPVPAPTPASSSNSLASLAATVLDLRQDIKRMDNNMEVLRDELAEAKTEISVLKNNVASLRDAKRKFGDGK